jgi:ABC-type transport system involved in multi-copper enzyme maturation permease subunit
MNGLIVKEIRLQVPALLPALALAIIPVWLVPWSFGGSVGPTLLTLGLATVILALGSFGRELGLGTFPLLLAHPVERPRIWWTKIAVLFGATLMVLIAWAITCFASSMTGTYWDGRESLGMGLAVALALVAGGLWSTLLLRHVAGAFLFTLLVPAAIAIMVGGFEEAEFWVFVSLTVYAVAGFILAWWLFRRAQETPWAGGVITLSAWRSAQSATLRSARSQRPFAALFIKELYLHQVSLAGIAALGLLHLGVIGMRYWFRGRDLGATVEGALYLYSYIWLLVPLLVGSSSIAEERKLGTMETHLGLPIARRYQFVIKFCLVMVLGCFLSFGVLELAESFADVLGVSFGMSILSQGKATTIALSTLMALSLISFYASSVSRNLLQSLAVAVTLAAGCGVLLVSGPDLPAIFGIMEFWRGSIFHWVAWPIIFATMLGLAYFNFGQLAGDTALLRRNLLIWLGALAAIFILASNLYDRSWEWATPSEPDPGPAQLSASAPPTVRVKSRGMRRSPACSRIADSSPLKSNTITARQRAQPSCWRTGRDVNSG